MKSTIEMGKNAQRILAQAARAIGGRIRIVSASGHGPFGGAFLKAGNKPAVRAARTLVQAGYLEALPCVVNLDERYGVRREYRIMHFRITRAGREAMRNLREAGGTKARTS